MFELRDLYKLNQAGVFALKNSPKKRVLVSYGSNMLVSLSKLVGDLKSNKDLRLLYEDLLEDYCLEIEILEVFPVVPLREVMKIKVGKYCADFEATGFELYRKYRNRGYTIKQAVSVGHNVNVEVWLCTKKEAKYLVGIFDTVKESDEWIARTYPDKAYIYPIYADNLLTREYLNKGKR